MISIDLKYNSQNVVLFNIMSMIHVHVFPYYVHNRFEIHIWYTVIILVHLVIFVQWSGLYFHVQIHENFVLTVVLMLETSKKHIFSRCLVSPYPPLLIMSHMFIKPTPTHVCVQVCNLIKF